MPDSESLHFVPNRNWTAVPALASRPLEDRGILRCNEATRTLTTRFKPHGGCDHAGPLKTDKVHAQKNQQGVNGVGGYLLRPYR